MRTTSSVDWSHCQVIESLFSLWILINLMLSYRSRNGWTMPYKRLQVKVLIIFQSIIFAAHPSLANNCWQKKEIQELENRLKNSQFDMEFLQTSTRKIPPRHCPSLFEKRTLTAWEVENLTLGCFFFWRIFVTLSRENQIWDFISRKSRVNDPFMHLRVLICREIFCLSRRSV